MSQIRGRVLELLARGQADQDALEAHLSPQERAVTGELHAWSAKDHVAHNNFWREDASWEAFVRETADQNKPSPQFARRWTSMLL